MTARFRKALPLLLLLFSAQFRADAREVEFFLKDFIWRHENASGHEAYWDFLAAQGYTGVLLEVADPEGKFYFNSQTLAGLKWFQQPDLLAPFLKSWKERSERFKDRKLKMFLDVSSLARIFHETDGPAPRRLDKPFPRDIAQAILDLEEGYRSDEIVTDPFDSETQAVLRRTFSGLRKPMNLFAVSPGFDHFIKSHDFESDAANSGPFHRLVTQDMRPYPLKAASAAALPTMGLTDLAFALARTLGKEVWAGCAAGEELPAYAEHNVLLYRAAQYAPTGFLLVPTAKSEYAYDAAGFNFESRLKKDILEFHQVSLWKGASRKPVANLVLSARSRPRGEPYFAQFVEPVMNALLANGYDVRVTFGRLAPKAELYYVTDSDDWDEDAAFFEEILRLLDERKSRFYGTVVLHPMGEIRKGGRWNELRKFFKIPLSEQGWIPDLPDRVAAEGRNTPWKGTVASVNHGMTFIRRSAVASNLGEAVISQVFQNRTLALILKSGNHYLVNGNFLHLEAAYFLSGLMGGALQAPAPLYVTSDKHRTAALALAETVLRIKVPAMEIADEWKITRFDPNGMKTGEETTKGKEIFETPLKAYELVILQRVEKN